LTRTAISRAEILHRSKPLTRSSPVRYDGAAEGRGLGQQMQFNRLQRREFIALVGGGATWPLAAARAQQAVPAVGYLTVGPPVEYLTAEFRRGLAELGYVDGRNVTIEHHHADNQYERLPGLVAELVRRRAAVIVAITTPPALAVKAAATNVPTVFMVADDPVKLGMVASFARPGGNATGVSFLFSDLGPKQLGLLHDVIPRATRVGLLVDPHNSNAEDVAKELTAAGAAIGVEIVVAEASDIPGIDTAFATLVARRVEALVVGTDPFSFAAASSSQRWRLAMACPLSATRVIMRRSAL
jgi:putative tryptophan/tyrosine transport system substrate-binding protein